MSNIWYAYVSRPDAQKTSRYQTGSWPFWFKIHILPPFWAISLPRTLTNSSYRLNTTDFQFNQCHLQTLNMKSYQKVSPTSNMVSVMMRSIFMLRHKASRPYNFNIQFPMYTKFITHVNDVALNTSMHQYCVISIAPPTGHRNSDKHRPVQLVAWGPLLPVSLSSCFLSSLQLYYQ